MRTGKLRRTPLVAETWPASAVRGGSAVLGRGGGRRLQQAREFVGEQRPFAFALVLEVHEHVLPLAGGLSETVCPGGQFGIGVIGAAQAEVAEARRLLERRAALLMLGNAQSHIEASQAFEHLVGKPALVAEFERRAKAGRQLMQEILEACHVLL